MPLQKLSVVLPVRNREAEIRQRVADLIVGLDNLVHQPFEVIVVDDGSHDDTWTQLQGMAERVPAMRALRHDRPRGMEAAGQTGLERAAGELIFIQEADAAIRLDDLFRLLLIAGDSTVLAARAESRAKPLSAALIRRLRCYGTEADRQIEFPETDAARPGIQFVRRTHLQALTGVNGHRYRLEASSAMIDSVHGGQLAAKAADRRRGTSAGSSVSAAGSGN
jgi:glycosyltransferase involved in cell wall biosynthesis